MVTQEKAIENDKSFMMRALMRNTYSLYWGTVPGHVIARRRKANKMARASRRKNR